MVTAGSYGLSKQRTATGLLRFLPAEAGNGEENSVYVNCGTPFYITSLNGKEWVHAVKEGRRAGYLDCEQQPPTEETFTKIRVIEEKKDEDAFSLRKIENAEVRAFGTAKRHIASLRQLQKAAPGSDAVELSSRTFKEMSQALTTVETYCRGTEDAVRPSNGGNGGIPSSTDSVYSRQCILADLRLDQVLMDFVSQLFDTASSCRCWRDLDEASEYNLEEEEDGVFINIGIAESDTAERAGGNRSRRGADAEEYGDGDGGGDDDGWDVRITAERMKGFNILAAKAYTVIARMCTGNQVVSAYVAGKHRLAITNQYALIGPCRDVDWGIATTLQRLFSDNHGLLESVNEVDCNTYVTLAKDARDFEQFVSCLLLLTTMCEHAGKAYITSQDQIREQIADAIPKLRFNSAGAADPVVEINAPIAEVGVPYMDWKTTWMPLHAFLDHKRAHREYIAAVLKCLSALSFNRRHQSQTFARIHFAPYETAMSVIKDERINDAVRAGFIKLMGRLYIDTDPLQSGFVNPDRVLNDICDVERVAQLAEEIAKVVPDRPNWDAEVVAWVQHVLSKDSYYLRLSSSSEFHSPQRRFLAPSPWASAMALQNSSANRNGGAGAGAGAAGGGHGAGSGGGGSGSSQGGGRSRRGGGWTKLKGQVKYSRHHSQDSHACEVDANLFISEIMDLLVVLVKHGFVRQLPTVMQLMGTLLDFLQKSKGAIHSYSAKMRDDVAIVTRTKRKVCSVLSALLKIWVNGTFVSPLLSTFKESYTILLDEHKATVAGGGVGDKSPLRYSSKDGKKAAAASASSPSSGNADMPGYHIFDSAVHKLPIAAYPRGKFLWFRQIDEAQRVSGHQFVDALMGLAQYKDPNLTNSALNLLMTTFDTRAAAVKLLHNITITADPEGISALCELRRKKTKWAEIQHKGSHSAFEELRPIVAWFSDQFENADYGEMTVYMHQLMLRNEGVHSLVLRLIKEHIPLQAEVHVWDHLRSDPEFAKLFAQCFRFLRGFAQKNPETQAELATSDQIDLLVHCCRFGLGAETVLEAVITHADAGAFMTRDTMRKLVSNLFNFKTCRSPQYLTMLQAAIAPGGQTSEEKQTHFVELLLRVGNYDDTTSHAPGLDVLFAKLAEDREAFRGLNMTNVGDEKGFWLKYVIQLAVSDKVGFSRGSGVCASPPVFINVGADGSDGGKGGKGDASSSRMFASYDSSLDGAGAGVRGSRKATRSTLTTLEESLGMSSSDVFEDEGAGFAASFCIQLAEIFRICAEGNGYTRGMLSQEAPFSAVLFPLLPANIPFLMASERAIFAGLADALHFPVLDGSEQSAMHVEDHDTAASLKAKPTHPRASRGDTLPRRHARSRDQPQYRHQERSSLTSVSEQEGADGGDGEGEGKGAPAAALPSRSTSAGTPPISNAQQQKRNADRWKRQYSSESAGRGSDPSPGGDSKSSERLSTILDLGRSMSLDVLAATKGYAAIASGGVEDDAEFYEGSALINVKETDVLILKSIVPLVLSVLSHAAHALHRVRQYGVDSGEELMWEFQSDFQHIFCDVLESLELFYSIRIKLAEEQVASLRPTDRQIGTEQILQIMAFARDNEYQDLRDLLFSNPGSAGTISRLKKDLTGWQGSSTHDSSETWREAKAERFKVRSYMRSKKEKEERKTKSTPSRAHSEMLRRQSVESSKRLSRMGSMWSLAEHSGMLTGMRSESQRLAAALDGDAASMCSTGLESYGSAAQHSPFQDGALNRAATGPMTVEEQSEAVAQFLSVYQMVVSKVLLPASKLLPTSEVSWMRSVPDAVDFAGLWYLASMIKNGLTLVEFDPANGVQANARRKQSMSKQGGGPSGDGGNIRRRRNTVQDSYKSTRSNKSGKSLEATRNNLGTIFEHFQSLADPGVFPMPDSFITHWLLLISAVGSADDTTEAAMGEQRAVVRKLNMLGVPRMALYLLSMSRSTSIAARLGVELFKCSPVEMSVEASGSSDGGGGGGGGGGRGSVPTNHYGVDANSARPSNSGAEGDSSLAEVHPHTQFAFYKQLALNRKITQALFKSIRAAVAAHIEHLHRRSLGATPSAANQDHTFDDVVRLVEFFRYSCMGCYSNMQNLLLMQDGQAVDSVNVVGLITDLLHAYGVVITSKQYGGGFQVAVSTRSKRFPGYALKALQREVQELELLNELVQLLTELVSGPNRDNQDALMALNVCEPIYAILQYLGTQSVANSRRTLPTVLHAQDVFSRWMHEFKVRDTGTVCVQTCTLQELAASKTTVVPPQELEDAWNALQIIDVIEAINNDCEINLVNALLALVEGRDSGDPIFDSVCLQLFPDLDAEDELTVETSLLVEKLDVEYKNSLSYPLGIYDDTNGVNPHLTTIKLHILMQTLASSQEFGHKIRSAIERWNHSTEYPLDMRIGRLELILDGVLSVAYFPIPAAVIKSRNSTVLQEIKKDVIESTYLLTDQERVRTFLEKSVLVEKVMVEQAALQGNPLAAILYHEDAVRWAALMVAIALNCMYVFEVGADHVAWVAVGGVHMVLSVLMLLAYGINHFTIDTTQYMTMRQTLMQKWKHTAARGHISKIGGEVMHTVEAVYKFFGFWFFSTKMMFVLAYVVFSSLGNFATYKAVPWMSYPDPLWAGGTDHWYFVFGILDLFGMFHGMRIITAAIRESFFKLASTIALAFVLLYVLAVVGQRFFRGEYSFPDTETHCAPKDQDMATFQATDPLYVYNGSLVSCMRDHFYTFGVRPVFDPIGGISKDEGSKGFWMLWYAMVYNILLPFLLSGIIVGVITEAFRLNSERSEKIKHALDHQCYVCGFNRQILDQASPVGYLGHVVQEHNIWDFVAFIILIDRKLARHEHLTGPETRALRIKSQDRARLSQLWPLERALCINDGKASEQDEMGKYWRKT